MYHTKLEQLTTLTNRLNALAQSLGSSYFSADILRPTVSAEDDPSNPNALRDVMPERFSKLEKELVRGKGEMVSSSPMYLCSWFPCCGGDALVLRGPSQT